MFNIYIIHNVTSCVNFYLSIFRYGMKLLDMKKEMERVFWKDEDFYENIKKISKGLNREGKSIIKKEDNDICLYTCII